MLLKCVIKKVIDRYICVLSKEFLILEYFLFRDRIIFIIFRFSIFLFVG